MLPALATSLIITSSLILPSSKAVVQSTLKSSALASTRAPSARTSRSRSGRQRRSTRPRSWPALIASFHDWNPQVMMRIAYCESRWEVHVVNPVPVYEAGRGWLHSAGPLGVLGGSAANGMTNVRQAHQLYKVQGYGAWRGDIGAACYWSAPVNA